VSALICANDVSACCSVAVAADPKLVALVELTVEQPANRRSAPAPVNARTNIAKEGFIGFSAG
jgi:hypothetical protein